MTTSSRSRRWCTSPDGALRVFEAQPAFGPTDERVPGLVADLRAGAPAGVEITGSTPLFADIADMLSTRLWLVVGFVVGVSVLLLGLMFRSVVVPVKAAVMNLLSIGAAYGVLTAIFQWGWGAELLGLDHAMPVSSWMPILLFAVLFGLSMDYEVFLLSRIREDWLDTGDAHGSVVRGLSVDGPGHLRGRRDHGRRLPGLRQRGRRRGQAARARHGRRHRPRRDACPDGPRPGHDDDARPSGTGGCLPGSTGSCPPWPRSSDPTRRDRLPPARRPACDHPPHQHQKEQCS